MSRAQLEELLLCSKNVEKVGRKEAVLSMTARGRGRLDGNQGVHDNRSTVAAPRMYNTTPKDCQDDHTTLTMKYGDPYKTPARAPRRKLLYDQDDDNGDGHLKQEHCYSNQNRYSQEQREPAHLTHFRWIKYIVIVLFVCWLSGNLLNRLGINNIKQPVHPTKEPAQQLIAAARYQQSSQIEYQKLASKQISQLIDRLRLEGSVELSTIIKQIQTRFSGGMSNLFLKTFQRRLRQHRSINSTDNVLRLTSDWWQHCE